MSVFPFRWIPSTIIPNLWVLLKSIKQGIVNIIRWIPVVWEDNDWDWYYLSRVMEYKLRKMSKSFKKEGVSVEADKCAKEMLICAELLKRLMKDDIGDLGGFTRRNVARHEIRMQEWQRMLGRYIGKYLRNWWD
jgi:hypothetical protein